MTSLPARELKKRIKDSIEIDGVQPIHNLMGPRILPTVIYAWAFV